MAHRDLDRTEAALARERLYFLLGAAWRPPEQCLFRVMPALLRSLRSGAQTLGWAPLARALRGLEAWAGRVAGDVSVEALAFLEYQRLFAGRRPLVPLREEWYGSRGADAAELAEVRRAFPEGCPLARFDADEPEPTSLSAELNLMGRLCVVEWQAWGRGDARRALAAAAREHAYLDGHLARWVPKAQARIEGASRSPLYVGLGRLVAGLVAQDLDYLGEWRRCPEGRFLGREADG